MSKKIITIDNKEFVEETIDQTPRVIKRSKKEFEELIESYEQNIFDMQAKLDEFKNDLKLFKKK